MTFQINDVEGGLGTFEDKGSCPSDL